jgi:hypothetical protein
LATACTKRLDIAAVDFALAEHPPMSGVVHPYGDYLDNYEGKVLVVYFRTSAKLEDVAPEWSDHLYWKLVPCSGVDQGGDLYSGFVFRADAGVPAPAGVTRNGGFTYKLHVPLDLAYMRQHVVVGTLDVPRLVDEIGNTGTCVQLGGGQMDGRSLSSNRLPVPIDIRADSMALREPLGSDAR